MRWWALLLIVGILMLGARSALAQEGVDLAEPCPDHYYTACSQEPPIPLDSQPCYVSHIADYVPRAPERAMVALCQAAKAAMADPPHRTLQQLAVVNSAAVDLVTAVQGDPADAGNLYGFVDTFHAMGLDMLKLGARITAYGPRGSDDGSDPVSSTLLDIISGSSVLAGLQ